ncbi:hypothetical protein HHI36_011016 [Cryptolaemus montrouzieri]|uniref:Uncharacterized protein n=1 Tax=Cryptolaemus montrouzieri TaxID=559131 RepID=A0ABD2MKL1_9CUCU
MSKGESEQKCVSIRKLGRSRRNFLRNIERRQRRKRSHNRYYKNLRTLRSRRKYEELVSKIETFAVVDIPSKMEWKSFSNLSSLPQDVSEWHQKEQVAFWKSRALSLEYENWMLHDHLRSVYADHISSRSKTGKIHEQIYEGCDGTMDNFDRYTEVSMEFSNSPNSHFSSSKNPIESCKEQNEIKPPFEPIGKRRREEMEKLYGSHCPKIAGIETALQLNYEHVAAKLKPAYWPQLQLNLG